MLSKSFVRGALIKAENQQIRCCQNVSRLSQFSCSFDKIFSHFSDIRFISPSRKNAVCNFQKSTEERKLCFSPFTWSPLREMEVQEIIFSVSIAMNDYMNHECVLSG